MSDLEKRLRDKACKCNLGAVGQALRELCDAYPPFFPGSSRSVCVECHEVMGAEIKRILDSQGVVETQDPDTCTTLPKESEE